MYLSKKLVALVVVIVGVVAGSAAFAAIPGAGGVIHSCYTKSGGSMRVIDASVTNCKSTETSLDWNIIGPIVKQYHDLIADDVARDTRKLFSTEDFVRTTADDPEDGTLRAFFEGRRTFLLRWMAENAAAPAPH